MSFTIGSLFDGSGGFPLAAFMCGGEPVWASEIEPYPIAVTKSRFPYIKHLGSVTDIKGDEIDPVDVVSFGSPCQDLSVAGLRKGLKHEDNGDEETTRSGLFMDAVRIIKEMREATNGVYPRIALWENVPGAFSSNKGEDFRVVLEELIKIVEPTAVVPPVPKAGWAYADLFCGDGWSLAYRILDAQHWGVPQRRRRIYLVLDLGGERAGEILFKRDSLRGYFEEGRSPWQAVAGDVEDRSGTADRETECVATATGFLLGFRPENVRLYDETATTLCNGTRPCFTTGVIESRVFRKGTRPHSVEEAQKWEEADVTNTINTFDVGETRANELIVEQYLFENHSQDSRYKGPLDVSPMLPAQLGTGGNNQPFVVNVYESHPMDSRIKETGETSPTVSAKWHKGAADTPRVCEMTGSAEPIPIHDHAKPNGGQSLNYSGAVRTQYIVRRLTPTECARLQGFPDKWGHPDHKDDFTDEEYRFWLNVRNTYAEINGKATKEFTKAQMLTWYNKLHTDSSGYKMWGNGIALPCALYVMQGIADVVK